MQKNIHKYQYANNVENVYIYMVRNKLKYGYSYYTEIQLFSTL